MIAFQLDQCLDSKRFAKECHAEGLCQVQRFPSVLRNAEDPELLMTLMVQAIPLVTFDRALAHEHARFIPDNNPGIIVISNYPSPQTLTVSIAQKVLRRFKAGFPEWHQVAWRNSVVEITDIGVQVWYVQSGKLVRNEYLAFDAPGWQERLRAVLVENSHRGLPESGDV